MTKSVSNTVAEVPAAVKNELLETSFNRKDEDGRDICPKCGQPGFMAGPHWITNGKTDKKYYSVCFGHTVNGKRKWHYVGMAHLATVSNTNNNNGGEEK